MAEGQHYHDPVVIKFGVGLAGSLVSMRFIQGPWYERVLMCLGGTFLSYYGTTPVAAWLGFHAQDGEGLVGFLLGLFGMAIVAKLYEALQYIDAKRLSDSVFNRWFSGTRKR